MTLAGFTRIDEALMTRLRGPRRDPARTWTSTRPGRDPTGGMNRSYSFPVFRSANALFESVG